MTPQDWLTLAGLLTVQAGAVIGFVLRVERRITRLEVRAEREGAQVLPFVRPRGRA